MAVSDGRAGRWMRHVTWLAVWMVGASCRFDVPEVPGDAGTVDAPAVPRVVDTVPPDGAMGVDAEAAISATFDVELDASSVTPATAFLVAPGGGNVPATVGVVDRTITITPMQRLPSNASMTARITAQVRDRAGTALAADVQWTFTTGYRTGVFFGAQEFTVRDSFPADGVPDVFVGGTPPPRLLFIKKPTEDRAIVELAVSELPAGWFSARLDFDSLTLDPGGTSTRILIYRFDGNGAPDLSDYSRTQTLFASDFGDNGVYKSHTFDITAELEDARSRGVGFLGLLFVAEDASDRFTLRSSTEDASRAPRLTVAY